MRGDTLRRSLLLRHTTADCNDKRRIPPFQRFCDPYIPERPPLRRVAYAAGVEDEDIRLLGVFGALVARARKKSRELFGLVDIHLTAVGHYLVLHVPPVRARAARNLP